MDKSHLGRIGEQLALKYLLNQNHQHITANYHCRFGELDLITLSPSQILTFTEVKTRKSTLYGSHSTALTHQKIQKILKSALTYLQTNHPHQKLSWRIDFIGIQLDQQDKLKDLSHLKNILNG